MQAIIDSGIRANELSSDVHQKVDKVGKFLSLLLQNRAKNLNHLAAMSMWDSFTAEQASAAELATLQLLQHMARLSLLQRTGQEEQVRYRMHVLVREAAADLLEAPERRQLRFDARESFLRAMAAVGESAAGPADADDMLAAREVVSPELGNCRRLCAVPAALLQDKCVMNGLLQLLNLFSVFGFYSEAGGIVQQVRVMCMLHCCAAKTCISLHMPAYVNLYVQSGHLFSSFPFAPCSCMRD